MSIIDTTQIEETPMEESAPFVRSGLPREEVLALLRARLMQDTERKLKDVYGTPIRGIKTGLDEAFIVDRATRDALIAADPKSEELLKPFARASSLDRWYGEVPTQWIIHTVPGTVNIDDYPAIRQHLEKYREQLEKRGGDSQWFELAQAEQPGNGKQVVDMKISFRSRSNWAGFTLERQGVLFCDESMHIPNGDYYLAGLLNSRLFWHLLTDISPPDAAGVVNLSPSHFENLPFPLPEAEDLGFVGGYAHYCLEKSAERNEFHQHICFEIAKHLAPGGKVAELSADMMQWYMHDASSLSAEAKRHFGKEIAPDMLRAWDDLLLASKDEWSNLNFEIMRTERLLDMAVYRIFGLNEEEIEHLDKD